MADVKGRAEPQLTANDLALYLVSTDVGKLGIIRRNKYPSKPAIIPYQDAKRTIVQFLIDPARAKSIIFDAIERFREVADNSATTQFRRDDARRSITALDAFWRAQNQLELSKYTFREAPRLPPLMVSNVKVSTNLDLLTTATVKGRECQGGVLLRLSLPEDGEGAKARRDLMGGFTATLAYMQVENKRPLSDAEPLARISLAIDVQHQQRYEAKAGASQKRSNIIAACTMIASIWPSV